MEYQPADDTARVTVVLDDTRRIRNIVFDHLDQTLRIASELVSAVERAYQRAIAEAWDRDYWERTGHEFNPPDDLVAITPVRASIERPADWGQATDAEIRLWRDGVTHHGLRDRRYASPGTSRNTCVIVTLNKLDHFGDLAIDQGWLNNALAADIASALTEAFHNAYLHEETA